MSPCNRERRRALDQAIAEYAREMAGTPADLDEDLERAGAEHLLLTGSRR